MSDLYLKLLDQKIAQLEKQRSRIPLDSTANAYARLELVYKTIGLQEAKELYVILKEQ